MTEEGSPSAHPIGGATVPDGSPTARLDRLLAETRLPTPFLILDLDVVRARYAALRESLPTAEIYYAVKANPAREIVTALAELGA
ncbi:MAG: hypothetical protein ACREEU_10890, partial [Acetobacteraceae bacterium]